VTNESKERITPGQIAVAIPCFNEAAAIATVISDFRAALPEAEIVVFDNNSSDGTGDIARSLGVQVVSVIEQGKGHAVRAAFAALTERDVLILTDGDGTYPASAARALIAPVLADAADMAVAAREPVKAARAMTMTRGIGNVLIRAGFRLLIGAPNRDLLSGYRAFNRHFREIVRLRSAGFEIETELASEAVARGLRVAEIPCPYHPRIAGTESKLRAFRDGCRIFRTILTQSLRMRPYRPLVLWLVPMFGLAILLHWGFAAAAWIGLVAMVTVLLADVRARRRALGGRAPLAR
jgi:glycosyltransferase involved in cell wall biosynthesis